MRSPLALGFVALLLPACLIGGEIEGIDEGGGTGGEGGGGSGGGGGGGDGSGSGTQPTPRVEASLDKTMVSSELGKTETLTLTITGSDGFAGPVTVTPKLLDGTTPVTGWTLTATPSSVDLPANGTAMVAIEVKVPTDAAVLAPTLAVDLGSTAAPVTASASLAVANQVTLTIGSGTGTGAPHAGLPGPNAPLRLRMGARVIFQNSDTIQHVIHASGGIDHQPTGQGQPNTSYSVVPDANATWYCHSHEGGGMARPILIQ